MADRDFDAAFARSLGQAFGSLVAEAGKKLVSVGRDCRLTSDKYAAAVAEGIRSTGVAVVDIGMCPTPLMYFSLFHWDLDGGIQVTGSHNPAEHNGFKIELARRIVVRALTLAAAGTPKRVPALPASPLASVSGDVIHA